VGAEVAVGQQHRDCTGQHGQGDHQQEGRHQPAPDEEGHLHQRHAGGTHVEDGDDDVDRAHDGADTEEMHREDREVHPDAALHRERCIEGPARRQRAIAHTEQLEDKGQCQHQRRRGQQPEAPVIEAWQGHVRGTDHQRDLPVGKARGSRHQGAEDHDQRVVADQLVEKFRLQELQAGLEQLGPDQQGQHAADHEHREREQQVQGTDVLVVGREHPAAPAGGRMVMVVVGVIAVAVVVENCAHVGFLLNSFPAAAYLRAVLTSAGCTT